MLVDVVDDERIRPGHIACQVACIGVVASVPGENEGRFRRGIHPGDRVRSMTASHIFFGPFPADGHNAAVIVLRRHLRPIFCGVPGALCLHLYHNGRHDIQRGDVHLCGSGNIPRLVRRPDVVNAVVVYLGSAGAKAVQRRRFFLRGDRIAFHAAVRVCGRNGQRHFRVPAVWLLLHPGNDRRNLIHQRRLASRSGNASHIVDGAGADRMPAVLCNGKRAAVCRPTPAVQRIFRAGNAAVCVAVVLDGHRYCAVRPLFRGKRDAGHIGRGRVDVHLRRGCLAGGVARAVHHTGGHSRDAARGDGHSGVAHGTARPGAAVDAVLVMMDAAAVVARRCAPVRQARACVCSARKTHHRAVPLPACGRADLYAGRLGEVIAVIAARIHRHVDRDVYTVV